MSESMSTGTGTTWNGGICPFCMARYLGQHTCSSIDLLNQSDALRQMAEEAFERLNPRPTTGPTMTCCSNGRGDYVFAAFGSEIQLGRDVEGEYDDGVLWLSSPHVAPAKVGLSDESRFGVTFAPGAVLRFFEHLLTLPRGTRLSPDDLPTTPTEGA